MTDHTLDASATSEIERPQRALLTVDFVTAFSVEECRQWLEYAADQIDTQRVDLWDDDSFTIRCCRDSDPGDPYDDSAARVFEVRFWGTLEPRERGTWVWGTSIEESGENPEWPSRRTKVLLITLIILATAVLVLHDMRPLWIAALIVAISALWRFWTWRRRHSEALRVIAWIWETLYVPIKDTYPDETQA
jgi:hypothetical protein